jgi:hypothetical protein
LFLTLCWDTEDHQGGVSGSEVSLLNDSKARIGAGPDHDTRHLHPCPADHPAILIQLFPISQGGGWLGHLSEPNCTPDGGGEMLVPASKRISRLSEPLTSWGGWRGLRLRLVTSALARSLRRSRPRRSPTACCTPPPTHARLCLSEHRFGEHFQTFSPVSPTCIRGKGVVPGVCAARHAPWGRGVWQAGGLASLPRKACPCLWPGGGRWPRVLVYL